MKFSWIVNGMFTSGRLETQPSAFLDPFHANVRLQRLGNQHGTVRLLVVLQNRQPRPTDGEPTPVERMHELGFTFAGLGANLSTTRLEGFEIRAGRNLLVGIQTGKPNLDI